MSEAKPCSSCGKPVIWITDQNGTLLPINVVRVRTYWADEQDRWYYDVADVPTGSPHLKFISHFVTCPNASKHSKKAKTP